MNKKMKAALAGLAFVAGCEIGIALQILKIVKKYAVREAALKESIPEESVEKENCPEESMTQERTAEETAEEAAEPEPAAQESGREEPGPECKAVPRTVPV